jgi:hypothetical protein
MGKRGGGHSTRDDDFHAVDVCLRESQCDRKREAARIGDDASLVARLSVLQLQFGERRIDCDCP